MRLTRRGKTLLAILALAAAFGLIDLLTPESCEHIATFNPRICA